MFLLHNDQAASSAHTGSYSIVMGVKRPGRDVDRSPSSSVEVQNEWSCTSTLTTHLPGVDWDNFRLGFTLSWARKALRESTGIALLLTSALEGGEGSASRPGRTFAPGKDPVPIVQEAEWASGPV